MAAVVSARPSTIAYRIRCRSARAGMLTAMVPNILASAPDQIHFGKSGWLPGCCCHAVALPAVCRIIGHVAPSLVVLAAVDLTRTSEADQRRQYRHEGRVKRRIYRHGHLTWTSSAPQRDAYRCTVSPVLLLPSRLKLIGVLLVKDVRVVVLPMNNGQCR